MGRKYLFSTLAVWVFIFAFETLVHGLGLSASYMDQPGLFRTPEEGVAFLPLLISGHLLMAVGVVGIICVLMRAENVAGAACAGAFIGFSIGGSTALMQYVAMPLPAALTLIWAATSLLELTLAAALARFVFGEPVKKGN